jgi:hypothetical protein
VILLELRASSDRASRSLLLRPCIVPEIFCKVAKIQKGISAHQNSDSNIFWFWCLVPKYFTKTRAQVVPIYCHQARMHLLPSNQHAHATTCNACMLARLVWHAHANWCACNHAHTNFNHRNMSYTCPRTFTGNASTETNKHVLKHKKRSRITCHSINYGITKLIHQVWFIVHYLGSGWFS